MRWERVLRTLIASLTSLLQFNVNHHGASIIRDHARCSSRNVRSINRQILLVAPLATERFLTDASHTRQGRIRLHPNTRRCRLRDLLLLLVLCRGVGGDG